MDQIKEVFTFVIGVIVSFTSVGLMVWKFEPIQRGIIIIISSAIEKAFKPYADEQVKIGAEISTIKSEQGELEHRVSDIEKDIINRDKYYDKRFEKKKEAIENIEEKESKDMETIKENIKSIDDKLNIILSKNIKGV